MDAKKQIEIDSNITMRLRSDYGLFEHEVYNETKNTLKEVIKTMSKTRKSMKKIIKETGDEQDKTSKELNDLVKEKIAFQGEIYKVTSRINSIEELMGCPLEAAENESPEENINIMEGNESPQERELDQMNPMERVINKNEEDMEENYIERAKQHQKDTEQNDDKENNMLKYIVCLQRFASHPCHVH